METDKTAFSYTHKKQHEYLTILTEKKQVLINSVQLSCSAASDLFQMFTQPVTFYAFYYHVLRVQIPEKCDSSNRQ